MCDPARAYKILIADPVGFKLDAKGESNLSEVRAHIEALGGLFHHGPHSASIILSAGIHFFYQPNLRGQQEILAQTGAGQYDALIAAATRIPEDAVFLEGGVRIGASTDNMGSRSWGGSTGTGGSAPLMNTPSFNSRTTAQMVFKAVLRASPDLPVHELHERVIGCDFDTGKHLKDYPTEMLEGKRIGILGFGNIGREVAKIARAFCMRVAIYAHPKYKKWCESEGFEYAATAKKAAKRAAFISVHTGLGALENGRYANEGLVDQEILDELTDGAVVVNYDRGQIVNIVALRNALMSGKVRSVCVDADIFIEADGSVSGPMVPYLELARCFPGAFELLPHAAADTEHISRVTGAKQAVNQIVHAIRYREVVNLMGDLPSGYIDLGPQTVSGVGRVSAGRLLNVASNRAQVSRLRAQSQYLATFWDTVASTQDPGRRANFIERRGARLLLESNRLASAMEELGLRGPYMNAGSDA